MKRVATEAAVEGAGPSPTVERIADEGMADVAGVHANLVGSPGGEPNLEGRHLCAPGEDPKGALRPPRSVLGRKAPPVPGIAAM